MKRVLWIAATLAVLALAVAAIATTTGRRVIAALSPAESVSAAEVARTISLIDGRPALILLYDTTSPLSKKVFPGLVTLAAYARDKGADVVAYSIDEGMGALWVSGFLVTHDAPFAPRRIEPWRSGELDRAMTTVGIGQGPLWARPVVVVRSREGHIVYQAQAVEDLAAVTAALREELSAPAPDTAPAATR